MPQYLFILGTASVLCREEILAVLKTLKISFSQTYSSDKVLRIETTNDLDCVTLMNILGGTVKIAKVGAKIEKEAKLIEAIISLLDTTSRKVIFGISWFTNVQQTNHFNDIYQYSRNIKSELEKSKVRVRFLLPKEREQELSSVVIEKQKVQEIIICEENKELVLAKTEIVQKFEQWNKRDYQRPAVAPDLGMLPPKVARMMVNIGYGKLEMRNGKNLTLLDPFCGMGTILAEAMLTGLTVYGNDNQQKAIESTQKNLDWICNIYKLDKKYQLFVADATHVSEKLKRNSIDLIVTEPYLGSLIESDNRKQLTDSRELRAKNGKIITPGYIERVIDGLERLYIGCLKDWHEILTKNGIVAIVLPSYLLHHKEFFVKKVVDNSTKLGYSIEVGPLPYSRKQAIVRRNIYIFKKL